MPTDEIQEFINYRLGKSDEVYEAAIVLFNAGQWNSAVNRLYYSCFYAASALLLQRGIGAKSHSGVISKFSDSVVRTGEMSADTYRVYSKLLNWRTKGDYSDLFDFSQEDVKDVLEPTKAFVEAVRGLLK